MVIENDQWLYMGLKAQQLIYGSWLQEKDQWAKCQSRSRAIGLFFLVTKRFVRGDVDGGVTLSPSSHQSLGKCEMLSMKRWFSSQSSCHCLALYSGCLIVMRRRISWFSRVTRSSSRCRFSWFRLQTANVIQTSVSVKPRCETYNKIITVTSIKM